MTMVEVRLAGDLVAKWNNDISVGNHVCREFVRLGVPVAGCLVPRATAGRVVAYVDDVFDEHVWEWHP